MTILRRLTLGFFKASEEMCKNGFPLNQTVRLKSGIDFRDIFKEEELWVYELTRIQVP